jgi:tetratricopeptide (TPR) repeat protein
MALLHYERAIAEEQTDEQRLDLAEVVCRQAQLINRDYAPIYNTWGLIKVRRGDIIEALRMFERAVQLNNSIFEAHMNFGQITLSFRGYEDARRSFARAVELQNNSYDAHIGLGAALRGLNQLDQAEAEYNRARELDGNRPEAYYNLGILYQDYKSANAGDPRPDIRRATEYFQQFLAKARGNRAYANSVEDVERRCQDQQQGRRGRRRARSTDCRPGRLQNMEQMIRDLDEVGQMQREAEALQRQQEQQMRELQEQERQQQQQQQPPGGGGGN